MIAKYKSYIESAFECQMQSLDYMNNEDGSKTVINDWIQSCTNGNIKELYNDLDSDTVCVLVSYIYFKVDWYDKFKSRNTRDAKFYRSVEKTYSI